MLDPACGTGGFLTCTIDHVRKEIKRPEQIATLQTGIRGGKRKKPLPHLLCTDEPDAAQIRRAGRNAGGNNLSRPLTVCIGWC